jgi:hypothetical protein
MHSPSREAMESKLRIDANKISHKGTKTQRGIAAKERKKKAKKKSHAKTQRLRRRADKFTEDHSYADEERRNLIAAKRPAVAKAMAGKLQRTQKRTTKSVGCAW